MKIIALDVRGVRIHGIEEGSGEPILFLHGWGASSRFWEDTLAALRERYRCIAIDWPGWGDSEKPDVSYTAEWYAAFVAGVLDALGLAEARIVAHSMGGSAAAAFALAQPARVRRLVLVNPILHGPTALRWAQRFALLPGIRWIVYALAHVRWIRRLGSKTFTHAARLRDENVDDVLRCTPQSAFRSAEELRRVDLAGRLSELRGKAFMINTDCDALLRPTQLELQRSAGFDVAVLCDTGHCPMLERPEEFHRILEKGLRA